MQISISRCTTAIIFALFATAACGSNGTDNTNPGGNNNPACTIMLTGAASGTPSCTAETAFWAAQSNSTSFSINAPDSAAPEVAMIVGFAGQPVVGTYHQTDTGANSYFTVTSGANAWVAAGASATAGGITLGSYTVTITSVATSITDPSGNIYVVHGSIAGTLNPMAGTSATGTVTLNVTF